MASNAHGIDFHMRRVPAADIPRVLSDPDFATLYASAADAAEFRDYDPSGPEIQASLDRIRNETSLQSALGRALQNMRKLANTDTLTLDRYMPLAEAYARDLRPVRPGDLCHLDRAWHVLHFAFTDQSDVGVPPAGTLCAGAKVGQRLVYGHARLADPAMTLDFAAFLDTQDIAALHRRAVISRMHALAIYGCEKSDIMHADRAHRWLREYLPRLRRFVRDVADAGDAMLMWLR